MVKYVDEHDNVGTSGGYALAGTYNAESRARASHPGQPFSPNVLRTYQPLFSARSLNEAEFTGRLQDDAVAYIRAHPGYVAETVAWNMLRVLEIQGDADFRRRFASSQVQALGVEAIDSPVAFLGSLYAVIFLTVVGAAAQAGLLPSRRAPLFVWAVPVLLLLPALAIYGIPRYRAPVDPYLVMLAAVGAVGAFDRWVGRTESRAPRG